MYNSVQLIGNLGKDPEIKYLPAGDPVCNFSMATSDTWKKDGEKVTKTEWHNIVAWGKLAEVCAEYLNKGKLVFVEGKIQTRSWDDKEGNKKYMTEIKIHTMKMLGGKGEGKPQEEREQAGPAADLEDVPF